MLVDRSASSYLRKYAIKNHAYEHGVGNNGNDYFFQTEKMYTFEYHISYTDGKISVTIIYFYYLFFQCRPTH